MTQKISRINAPEAAQGNPGHPYWKTSQYRASLTRAARRTHFHQQLYARLYVASYEGAMKPIPWNKLPSWVRNQLTGSDQCYVRHIEG